MECPICKCELEWYDYMEVVKGNYSEVIGEIYTCPACCKRYSISYDEGILTEIETRRPTY